MVNCFYILSVEDKKTLDHRQNDYQWEDYTGKNNSQYNYMVEGKGDDLSDWNVSYGVNIIMDTSRA